MRAGSWTIGVAAAALTIAGCNNEIRTEITGPTDHDPITREETFEWLGVLTPGQEIEIKGLAGDIFASAATGTNARVHASKRGRFDDARSVRIVAKRHNYGVTVCAVYPTKPGHPQNECRRGDNGPLNSHNNDVEVTFNVSVPPGVRLIAKAVAGNVDASGLNDDVVARTVAGNIHISTEGVAEAATVTGSIDATLGASEWTHDLKFATVTGDVSVRVPMDTNARVNVAAGLGGLSSDFPLESYAFGHWEGTLGRGGPMLTLSSLSGRVTLRSGS